MPRPLRFSQRCWLLLGLALFPLLTGLVACSKKNSPDPASVVGAVEGTVAPAGSINLVLLAAPGASSSQAAQPDGNGHFKFDNVNAGNYEVSFRENSGYLPPSPRTVTVTAGTTASVGTVAVSGSTGAVEGTVTPVNSIYLVVLTTPGSTNGPATTPDVNGYFKFNNVAAGTYNVSFRENSGYVQPSPRTVTVTTGATASVGTITVSPTGPTSASLRGTVSWSRSGTNYNSSTVGGSVSLTNGAPSSFSLLATSQNGTIAEIMGLNLPYFSATPTLYRLENVMLSGNATYVRSSGGIPYGSYGTSGYAGLLGTVTVTAVNTTARTITGTFGFTAYDPRGSAILGTDRVDISNGAFNLSY